MSEPTREQIERRAYELWQRAGFPNGRDKEFEHQAEQELRNQECSVGAPAMKHEYNPSTPRRFYVSPKDELPKENPERDQA
jgi:hypothetical protein